MKTDFMYFILLASMLLLCQCDNRTEHFSSHNSPPILQLRGGESAYDSAKYSLKIKQSSVNLPVVFSDSDNNLKELRIVRTNGQSVKSEMDVYDLGTTSIKFLVSGVGVNTFEIVVKDEYGSHTTGKYTITVFENLPPVANLKLVPSGSDKFWYTMDASASTDQDRKFGGIIFSYTFTIDGNTTFVLDKPTWEYHFASTGTHTVKVNVTDNDGGRSSDKIETLTIN